MSLEVIIMSLDGVRISECLEYVYEGSIRNFRMGGDSSGIINHRDWNDVLMINYRISSR